MFTLRRNESYFRNVCFFTLTINRFIMINRDVEIYAIDFDTQSVKSHPNTHRMVTNKKKMYYTGNWRKYYCFLSH